MQAVGFIDKQILPLEDAWYVEYIYDSRRSHNRYRLRNNLKVLTIIYKRTSTKTRRYSK